MYVLQLKKVKQIAKIESVLMLPDYLYEDTKLFGSVGPICGWRFKARRITGPAMPNEAQAKMDVHEIN